MYVKPILKVESGVVGTVKYPPAQYVVGQLLEHANYPGVLWVCRVGQGVNRWMSTHVVQMVEPTTVFAASNAYPSGSGVFTSGITDLYLETIRYAGVYLNPQNAGNNWDVQLRNHMTVLHTWNTNGIPVGSWQHPEYNPDVVFTLANASTQFGLNWNGIKNAAPGNVTKRFDAWLREVLP